MFNSKYLTTFEKLYLNENSPFENHNRTVNTFSKIFIKAGELFTGFPLVQFTSWVESRTYSIQVSLKDIGSHIAL